jgi:hypothetical protein
MLVFKIDLVQVVTENYRDNKPRHPYSFYL